MHLGPPLYLTQLVLRALRTWGFVRGSLVGLAFLAGWPRPFALAPGSILPLAAVVVVISWLELHRRNLTALLPTLGVSVSSALAVVAAGVMAAELALVLILR